MQALWESVFLLEHLYVGHNCKINMYFAKMVAHKQAFQEENIICFIQDV